LTYAAIGDIVYMKSAIGVLGTASLVSDTNCPAGFTFLLGCFDLLRAFPFVPPKNWFLPEKLRSKRPVDSF
jgi:hypothetical protein